MARIARRALRLRELPLFSLGAPWTSVVESDTNMLGLRLFEPRYLEMARRILPPQGSGKFGYAESYPPRPGTSGMLTSVQEFEEGKNVMVLARGERRFRILATRAEAVEGSDQPLYIAHVQLLEDRDCQREVAKKLRQPTELLKGVQDAEVASKASQVFAGSHLVANMGAPVFESLESWRVIGQVPAGVRVIAGGPPTTVEGYFMVPIVPSGAVEMTLFRRINPAAPDEMNADEADLPREEALKASLLNLGQAPPQALSTSRGRKHAKMRRRGKDI